MTTHRHTIAIKRAYEPAGAGDGYRILVDRLWPRGLRKAGAHLDLWLKDIAPSPALRTWFDHDPARFAEFSRRYVAELQANPGPVAEIEGIRAHTAITLVYAAHDETHNHAVVLKGFLESRRG